jgi:hypothetical protein
VPALPTAVTVVKVTITPSQEERFDRSTEWDVNVGFCEDFLEGRIFLMTV